MLFYLKIDHLSTDELMHISYFHYKDDLSYGKSSTQSHTFPGSKDLYGAKNAVDENTNTCMRTETIGTGTQIPKKTVWWIVDLGGVFNIYSINVLFKNYDGYGI